MARGEHDSPTVSPEDPDLGDLWNRWQSGDSSVADDLLAQSQKLTISQLADIVCGMLRLRFRAGEQVAVESYLERFPRLKGEVESVLDVVYCEYLARIEQGERVSVEEYAARFPELASAIRIQFLVDEALLSRNGNHSSHGIGDRSTSKRGIERSCETLSDHPVLACPHCRNSIPIDPCSGVREVVCPACGSSFGVVSPDSTVSYGLEHAGEDIGRFRILQQVGMGAFGTVYKAHDTELDRVVALKIPRLGTISSSEGLSRFLREARSVAQLRHPGIVPVHEVGMADHAPYLVCEFIDGVTLSDRLTAGSLSQTESASLVASVADALDYAHRHGVIHRDVKPSNILLDAQGDPKLMDFGLAKREVGEVTMTIEGQVLGTPAYMSPEQAAGESHVVDGRSDTYSLGVVLYELLTGELPFRGNSRMLLHQVLHEEPRPPRSLNDRISRDLETICTTAMAKEPRRRYASAGAFAEDLRRHLSGEPIRARPVRAWERAWKWTVRRPATAGLIAVSTVALLLLSVGGWWSSARLRDALATSEAHRLRAQEGEEAIAQRLYVSDMQLAAQSYVSDDGPGMRLFLGRQLPKAGRRDYRGFAWHYLWAVSHSERLVLKDHAGDVYHVAFSPDGRTFATAGKDGTVRLRDLATGDTRRILHCGSDEVNGVHFSRDGHLLASAGEDGNAWIWKVASGELQSRFEAHPEGIYRALITSDGLRLVTCGKEPVIRVWEIASGRLLGEIEGHTDDVQDISLSPDDRYLGSASDDWSVRVWDLETLAQRMEWKDFDGTCCAVAISHDGKKLAASSQERIHVWRLEDGEKLATLKGHRGGVNSLQWSHEDSLLVSASRDGLAICWHDGAARNQFELLGHDGDVWSAGFSNDGRDIVTTGADGTVRVYDAGSTELRGQWLPNALGTLDVAFSADSKLLACAGFDGSVCVVDVETRRTVAEHHEHTREIASVAFSKDGRWLASGGLDQQLVIWDMSNREVRTRLNAHEDSVARLSFSGDGRYLASLDGGDTVFLWRVDDWGLEHRQTGLPNSSAMSFSPDSRVLFISDAKRLLRYRVDSWERLPDLPAQASNVWHLAFSSDGTMYATASDDRDVKIWRTRDDALIGVLPGTDSRVTDIHFSPYGNEIGLAQHDDGVVLRDVQTERLLMSLDHFKSNGLAFSANGKYLASARFGKGVLLCSTERLTMRTPLPVLYGEQVLEPTDHADGD